MKNTLRIGFGLILAVGCFAQEKWSARERALIDGLRIVHLNEAPADPSNRFSDREDAARLGEKLFSDVRLSDNGEVSCATCHRSDYGFTDDLPIARGVGTGERRTMPLEGVAYYSWFFWDGRADSLWSQALSPLESEVEHGFDRERVAQVIHTHYRAEYESVVGTMPDAATLQSNQTAVTEVFVNCGKMIAAFVRTIEPGASRFDHYAAALEDGDPGGGCQLSTEEERGLRLFISGAKCINCHNGPMFSNGEFHHVGVPDSDSPDRGRAAALAGIATNEFGCLGAWSDADPDCDCGHVDFLNPDPAMVEKAFKTPSLRNVAGRAPFMHAGQFASLSELLHHYRAISGKNGVDEIFHGDITDDDLRDLEAFLTTLSASR